MLRACLALFGTLLLVPGASAPAGATESAPWVLAAKIPLGAVRGRIDHLAFDTKRHYVYVAELGNDSVGVVDVQRRQVVRRLTGLRQPQGIGYVPSTDTVYVANGGDGSVRLFRGADLAPIGQIALGDDADNIRVDDAAHRVFVGYGSGALAVIDSTSRTKVADIALKAHPESFQLQRGSHTVFVNVPDAHEIALVDVRVNRQVAFWSTRDLRANFPMALDESNKLLLAVFRRPARLGVWSQTDGSSLSAVPTCRDSDDMFLDAKRHRVYVICGQGFVEVFSATAAGELVLQSSIATVVGARTGLFVPELDRLFLAVRSAGPVVASIWVFSPNPTATPPQGH